MPVPTRLALATLAVAACGHHAAPTDPPLPKRTVHVEPARSVTRTVGEEVVGTVRARDAAEISPSVMGTLTDVRCVLGTKVGASDVIARLSAKELDARLAHATEGLAQANIELTRATRLRDSGAVTGAEFDTVASRVRMAQAEKAEAAAMVGYTVVRAPFAGVVTAKLASAGDVGLPGHPICVIENPGTLRFEVTVPEPMAHVFTPDRALAVRLDALDAPLTARVAEVSPIADPTSRTVLVKLTLPPDPRIRAGAFGRATIPASERRALVAPSRAVVRHGQLEAVFVVADGVARLRLVKTGRAFEGPGDAIELLSGVREGEPVIVADVEAVIDGQPVEVTP
jgi:RND family efflux transporter MFP subunit